MMAVIAMLLLGTVFGVAFRSLLRFAAGRRVWGAVLIAIGFLIAYLGYSVGYLLLFDELRVRWPAVSDFGTWTDDVAAVVPFAIAIAIFWRSRRARAPEPAA